MMSNGYKKLPCIWCLAKTYTAPKERPCCADCKYIENVIIGQPNMVLRMVQEFVPMMTDITEVRAIR
jgi:hypothetical protein